MIGAIIGDIAGSRFEFNNHRSKDFELLAKDCYPTDDSFMSLAVAKAILEGRSTYELLPEKTVQYMQEIGRAYPHGGYGGMFGRWLYESNPKPYNSFGNGAAMRVSPCGFAAGSLEEVKKLSHAVTAVTHNHPEGLKGAEAAAVAIFLGRKGESKNSIRKYMEDNYYCTDFTLDEIRNDFPFDETCQGTLPAALEAFYESTDFEDAIRNAVSIGGDSDTIAAITGGIAQAYYGVPDEIRKRTESFLDQPLLDILRDFEMNFLGEE